MTKNDKLYIQRLGGEIHLHMRHAKEHLEAALNKIEKLLVKTTGGGIEYIDLIRALLDLKTGVKSNVMPQVLYQEGTSSKVVYHSQIKKKTEATKQ